VKYSFNVDNTNKTFPGLHYNCSVWGSKSQATNEDQGWPLRFKQGDNNSICCALWFFKLCRRFTFTNSYIIHYVKGDSVYSGVGILKCFCFYFLILDQIYNFNMYYGYYIKIPLVLNAVVAFESLQCVCGPWDSVCFQVVNKWEVFYSDWLCPYNRGIKTSF